MGVMNLLVRFSLQVAEQTFNAILDIRQHKRLDTNVAQKMQLTDHLTCPRLLLSKMAICLNQMICRPSTSPIPDFPVATGKIQWLARKSTSHQNLLSRLVFASPASTGLKTCELKQVQRMGCGFARSRRIRACNHRLLNGYNSSII